MSQVNLRKGENVDKALKKLKRKLLREGTIDEMRKRKYYEKPTSKKYKQNKRAKYIQQLKAQEEKDYWS